MPDFNPAVALGIQPPQAPENNFASTLGTIANLQEKQALTGYYTLQGLQQQRQYSALQATAAHIRDNPGDSRGALQVYYGAGGDPAGGPSIVNSLATANATAATPGGMLPSEWAQRMSGLKTATEIPGTRADADKRVAETYGPAVYLNPSDDGSYAQLVNAHFDAAGERPGERQAALGITDPNQRKQAAIRYGFAAGVPIDKLAETFSAGDTDFNDYNNKNLTPAQRVGAAPIPRLREPGEVAQAHAEADATVKYLQEEGNKRYTNAQALKASMVNINHDIETLGPAWMGWGAETKAEALKAVNSVFGQFGMAPISPDKSASAEDFVKETIRAGMQLINSNFGGSREAASIVQMGKTANASINNSYLGAKYVASTIGAMAQRETDLYEYQAQHKNQLPALSAVQFNKLHPPEDYAMRGITNVIPEEAKKTLLSKKDTPGEIASFDKTFGPGTAEFLTR